MANLLDLMKPEDRAVSIKRYNERVKAKEVENKISSEVFLVAEFGYYFGWDAVQAVRNNEITLEEMFALLEGAKKVWYQKLVEQYRMTSTSVGSCFAKKGEARKIVKDGIGIFIEKGKI